MARPCSGIKAHFSEPMAMASKRGWPYALYEQVNEIVRNLKMCVTHALKIRI